MSPASIGAGEFDRPSLSHRGCRAIRRVKGNAGVGGIEQQMALGSAGRHGFGQRSLAAAALARGLGHLPGDGLLHCGFVGEVADGYFGEEPYGGGADRVDGRWALMGYCRVPRW